MKQNGIAEFTGETQIFPLKYYGKEVLDKTLQRIHNPGE
jgi:hypothetical protein